jgi:bifunctional DNase/RNase
VEIDARPSDAIAIGLRFNVPIFTHESVLSEAGIVLTDEESEAGKKTTSSKQAKTKPTVDNLKDLSFDKLQTLLNDALKMEDYEKAAKIRDEINRRN